jgi:hypothetical protein
MMITNHHNNLAYVILFHNCDILFFIIFVLNDRGVYFSNLDLCTTSRSIILFP